ncbi:MAG: ABC transporter substrate-binding protein, partial [Bacteroidetes bacterium]|nr:ABC transporter substrate-binding protein [Bacteroidota bacterium]
MKKLNRKEFLSKGTLALAGSSLLLNAACSGSESENSQSSISSNPQKTYKWKMVTTWPPNFPILGDGCKLMAQWVEKMSGGRLKIQVYGGGELVPALEAFDAVSSGAAEMANGGAYY